MPATACCSLSIHLLHLLQLYIVYVMLLAIGLNKIFLIPDSGSQSSAEECQQTDCSARSS